MPREIVHVSVGQCGNQIGHVFWNRMLAEHNITHDGYFNFHQHLQYEDFFKLDKIGVYFQESELEDKFVPRTALFDLEPGVIEKVTNSPIGALFHPDFVLTRASGSGNNWARGHYTMGGEVIDEAMDIIRKNAESCDELQGFQLSHSLGGGTGSGFGALIVEKLKDCYPDRIVSTWSIYPTQTVSDVVVEPYNAILSISHLLMESDMTFVTDNAALFDISKNILKHKTPSFAALNWILSLVIGGVTSSLRFPGLLNCDLRKMAVNLTPFPRLHFFSSAYSPLVPQGEVYAFNNLTLRAISDDVWSPQYLLTSSTMSYGDGKCLSASILYRGNKIASEEVESISRRYTKRKRNQFVEWIPNSVKTAIINVKPIDTDYSATLVGNITSVKDCFQRIWKSFNKLFQKRAFLHWYKGEGMHEMEFQDAEAHIKDLIMEYFEKQEIAVDFEQLRRNYNKFAMDESESEEEFDDVSSIGTNMEAMEETDGETDEDEDGISDALYIGITQSESIDSKITLDSVCSVH